MTSDFQQASGRILLDDPLTDGRQSETALKVWRGAARLLRQFDYACLPEVTLASNRRADLLALGPRHELLIVEVKSSIADFRADTKWPDYRLHCDRFYFATHPDVPVEIFPEEAGLILSDGFGAEILREAPEHKLAAATRKAVTLRFARNAANRLHDLSDPDGLRFFDRL
ncbi:MmcB family DNA repair protein [Roseibium salinum]|uniref:MmcB family DNA repair protein n=1 Tax=Roseibium salinum TaxID=1604349 RepID=A0ABT3R6C1_9HYPH|nr:MmcB family DNA repair protein [Roseibium sp. DSM 29163]MCX2724567.1 MmcB family DNA repair protein [Roseibium sp. DSM 29163]MDN3721427.1 MmcB family DNA repair protein [Roseibium salinum]